MAESNFDELLSAYLDDELSEADRSALKRQLADSADLRESLAELESLRAMFKALPAHELPDTFADRVLREAEHQMLLGLAGEDTATGASPPPSTRPAKRGRSRWLIWVPAALAATLIGILLVPPWFDKSEMAQIDRDPLQRAAEEEGDSAAAPADESLRRDQPVPPAGSRYSVADDGALPEGRVSDTEHRLGLSGSEVVNGEARKRSAIVMGERAEADNFDASRYGARAASAKTEFGVDHPSQALLVEVQLPPAAQYFAQARSQEALQEASEVAGAPASDTTAPLGEVYAVQGSPEEVNALLVNWQNSGALIQNLPLDAALEAELQKPSLVWRKNTVDANQQAKSATRGISASQLDQLRQVPGLQVAKVGEFPSSQKDWAQQQTVLKQGEAEQKQQLARLYEALKYRQTAALQDKDTGEKQKAELTDAAVGPAAAADEESDEQLTVFLWVRQQPAE